jgi:hypothetical protein
MAERWPCLPLSAQAHKEALAMDKITLTNAHGTFTTTGLGLDLVISEQLPASPNGLREVLAERCPEIDYSDIHSVTEALVMIADMDYPPA